MHFVHDRPYTIIGVQNTVTVITVTQLYLGGVGVETGNPMLEEKQYENKLDIYYLTVTSQNTYEECRTYGHSASTYWVPREHLRLIRR